MNVADNTRADEKYVLPVLFVLGCGYTALLFLSDLLPFVDLPFHLGVATIVRSYGEVGNQFSDYFTLQITGKPNVLHLWFCSSPFFSSVEFANKVYLGLYTFLLPLSLYTVIRELRGNTWFAVLSYLYLYNFSTHWGFVGFIGAIPAVFFLFSVVLRHLHRPTRWTRLTLVVGSLALFFVHVLAALFFLSVYWLSCLIDQKTDLRYRLLSVALTFPLIALIGWWWMGTSSGNGETLFEFMLSYYPDLFVRSFSLRSFFFSFDNSYLADGRLGIIWGGLIAAVSVSFLAWAAVFERSSFVTSLKQARNRPALAFLFAASFCYFVLPEGLPGQWALNQRFSVYFVLGAIAFSSVLELRRLPRGLVISVIVGACLFHGALYADYFRDFGVDSAGFTELILPESSEKRLAGLIIDPHFRGTLSYIHFSNYYIVRKQGIAVSGMVDFRFGTVRLKEDGADLPRDILRYDLRPDYAGEFGGIDYLVVRGEISPHLRDTLRDFEETVHQGGWSLLTRNESLVSVSQ
jgi:hypothetical protein